MKIYISVPITGHDETEVREHVEYVKTSLVSAGHSVVNPFDIAPCEKPTYADYLCADLRALADCDAIFLCNGWQFSRGCRIERTFADEFGLQIMTEGQ